MKNLVFIIFLTIAITFAGCNKDDTKINNNTSNNWNDIVKEGKNKKVTILMWGGNDNINRYMDNFVSSNLKELYNIEFKRVPMNAPEYLAKLVNEKKAGIDKGTADLLWINAENFKTAKQGNLLWGPFTHKLNNIKNYYNEDDPDLNFDTGIEIEGYEAIWGRAQLVMTYDSSNIATPPKNYTELLNYAKSNPGKITYPKLPDDFVGAAFIRNSYYELTGENKVFQNDMTKEEFKKLSQPVIDYFKEFNKYLWKDGKAFPATQAQQDELFKNGEINITMGFEIGKTSGLVKDGIYNKSVKTFVFDSGTIGNSHYLAIPYNSTNKDSAVLAIDFLQSPKSQIEKFKPEVWGDMPAFDITKLSTEHKNSLDALDLGSASLSIKELTDKRLPEMKSDYIEWIKELWIEEIQGK